jgi:hypothetical protein
MKRAYVREGYKPNGVFAPIRFAQYPKAIERLDGFARENYGKGVMPLPCVGRSIKPGVTAALWASLAQWVRSS